MPDSRYAVTVTDEGVSCALPDGSSTSVRWNDLEVVAVKTTDAGPFVADVFWVLQGSRSTCVVPQGLPGDQELVARLQQLPGFDTSALIDAVTSIEEATFICWQREEK
jgi:hypothetical protein